MFLALKIFTTESEKNHNNNNNNNNNNKLAEHSSPYRATTSQEY